MKRFLRSAIALATLFLISGCIDSEHHFTLNPDGSGKARVICKFQEMNLNMGNGEAPSPEESMKKAVLAIIDSTSGVDAWKDVSYELDNEGRIVFKGTAYFPKISKYQLKPGGQSMSLLNNIRFKKMKSGALLIQVESKDENKNKTAKRKAAAAKMSDAELRQKLKQERAKFQQGKPMLTAILGTMRLHNSFVLPGKLEKSINFKKTDDGVSVTFDGSKMLAVIERMVMDDELMLEQLRQGADLAKMDMDEDLNKELLGKKGPIKAKFSGGAALFDYEKEVAKARAEMPALMKALGAEGQTPPKAATESAFKEVRVVGAMLSTVSQKDAQEGIHPFNQQPGYQLSIMGEFDGAVLAVNSGMLESAIADNGDDLLPDGEWDRKIHFTRLNSK